MNKLFPFRLYSLVRLLVAAVFIGLVIARMVYPDLRFDQLSFQLLVVAAIVVLLPDIKDVLSRVRKIKKGDWEIELDDAISQLKQKAEEVKKSLPSKKNAKNDLVVETFTDYISKADSARSALLLIASDIEKQLRKLAQKVKIEGATTHSARLLVAELVYQNKVQPELVPLFEDFWSIRSRVMRHTEYELEYEALSDVLGAAIEISRLVG